MQQPGAAAFGQPQHVDHADGRRLDRLDRIVLIGDGRRRAGEVVDLIGFEIQRMHDVVPNDLEVRIVHQMSDVGLPPGEEVVDADDVVAPLEQSLTQMAAEKPGSAGHENGCHECVLSGVACLPSGKGAEWQSGKGMNDPSVFLSVPLCPSVPLLLCH